MLTLEADRCNAQHSPWPDTRVLPEEGLAPHPGEQRADVLDVIVDAHILFAAVAPVQPPGTLLDRPFPRHRQPSLGGRRHPREPGRHPLPRRFV